MRCFFCGGPAHPATGCQYSENVVACWDCTVEFWRWFRAQQHVRGRPGIGRGGRVHADFYTAAGRFNPRNEGPLEAERNDAEH